MKYQKKTNEQNANSEMKFGNYERQVCTFNMYCPKLS